MKQNTQVYVETHTLEFIYQVLLKNIRSLRAAAPR
jgi:hypothetical protein